MSADLLRLLEQAHPGRAQGDLLAMLEAVPDKAAQKPARARSGSRPRTDASMERRRSWAASGRLPPALAARFTLAEVAVLAVVSAKVAEQGACDITLDHIAALAGVCRTSVKNALRQAQALGFIRVEERRLSAWRNAPNLITIISPEWLAWMRLRTRRQLGDELKGGGGKFVQATNTSLRKQVESRPVMNGSKGFRRTEGEAGTLMRTQIQPRPESERRR